MKTNVVNRIPSLDGLRGLSILLVVFGHAFKELSRVIDIANLGVRIFFVISAYLIVGILYNDVVKERFSIKSFYFKRIMRTFPAFYFYLIIVFIFLNFKGIFNWEQFWRAPIYLENYHPRHLWEQTQWFVGHSWSLAVEEQFYLLVAILFFFFNKQSVSKSGLIKVLLLVVLLIPIIRIGYLFGKDFIPIFLTGSIHRSFETVADSLAVGGLLALLPKEKIANNKVVIFFSDKLVLLFGLILSFQFLNGSYIVSLIGLLPRYIYNLSGITLINLGIAVLVFLTIKFPMQTIFAKALNQKWIMYIGLWSYSIYLWQQLWLFKWEIPLFFKLLGILVCSLLSYYLIEIKFLSWRDSYLKRNAKN